MSSPWYASWFDSPYYPMLYKHRNDKEARQFIHLLHKALPLVPHAHVRDMACGHGRHALVMGELGWQVTGTDLSPESIRDAQQKAAPNTEFVIHDMRIPFREETFDAVFSLFTSLGYFPTEEEDFQVIQAAYHDLKDGGHFVLDFFNSFPISLLPAEQSPIEHHCGHVRFVTCKKINNGLVVKEIRIKDGPNHYEFQEQVRLYSKERLEQMLNQAGFEVKAVYGDYELGKFDPKNSPRCILWAIKIKGK